MKIYSQNFQELKGIKFSIREIDVAACILHNRGEKKIAAILNIMPKTVNAHVYNIMLKLRCNSREYIIDFFEKSDKLQSLQQYYKHLLIENNFKQHLIKIGREFNKQQITYTFNLIENSPKYEGFFDKLKGHLKLANINIRIEKYTIDNFSQEWEQAEQEGYYNWALQFIKKLINRVEINQIIKNFNEEFKILTGLLQNAENPTQVLPVLSLKKLSKIKLFYIAVIIISILSSSILLLIGNDVEILSNGKGSEAELTIQNNISNTLPEFFENLSVRNLTREEADSNYSIIKQFDQVIKQINLGKIQNYHSEKLLQSNELINSIYNLNAIASYSLFIEHNALKAEKVLKYAKSLAENYVSARGRVKINFDKLTVAEIYAELFIIRDLPQMYTITTYFLARSYLYQKNIELAEKHFELAKDLGKKLGLFEEALSIINGLAIIKGDQVDIDIKNGNYEQAKRKIKECIKIYEKAKEDKREYKKNYRPNNQNPATIILEKDIYNVIACNKRIVKLYTKLIPVTDNKNEIKHCLEAISYNYIGSNTSPGVLEILTKSDYTLARIAADSYNSLGYFLLKLYDKNIDFRQFKNAIVQKLKLTEKNELNVLEVIYRIFDLAKSLSRNTEFSKADAYDGLVNVCERLINYTDITEEKRKKLLVKIQGFKEERDVINKELQRNVSR